MSAIYNAEKLIEFFVDNKDDFQAQLLKEAVNVREKIEEILLIGNVDLLNNAQKLIHYILEEKEEEIIAFARQEGIAWATHSLTLSFKLEWVQAIRRTLWNFLYNFETQWNVLHDVDVFFELARKVNEQIDHFLRSFFISYSDYKDQLILAQQSMVEKLSVPIIPITPATCILPLIGTVDAARINIIEEKVLMEIGKLRIQILILDMSGILEMEPEILTQLMNILDGTSMMGCKVVITGMRPEIVTKMVRNGLNFDNKAETKGTLQQALRDYVDLG